MRLTRCYIENFGTLHQFELKFGEGINVIKAPNGFGKTTLAAFIRAMLYGLPRGNKNSLEKDLRRKYYPWQGGRFGGCIEFELKGKSYRAERFFGDKPIRDSFTLYELPEMRKSKDFSENLGVEIFGLDAESFERSTCMAQLSETGALSTDSIQAKLGNLVEDTGDINNYEKAVAALRKARASLIPYRGTGGEVFRASEKITALQTELSRCSAAREALPALTDEIASLEKEADRANAETESLRRELLRASEQAAAESLSRERDGLLRRREELKAEKNTLLALYPKGIPSREEADRVCVAADRLAELNSHDSYRAAELLERKNAAEEKAAANKKNSLRISVLVLAVVLGAVGIALLVTKNYVPGAAGLALGLVCAAFVKKRSTGDGFDGELEAFLREYARLNEESELAKKRCREEIEAFFRDYGLDRDGGGIMRVRDDALRYEELSVRLKNAEAELREFDLLHPEIMDRAFAPKAESAALRFRYEALGKTLPVLNRELAEKRREAAELQERMSRAAEAENAIEHWKEVKSRGIKKAEELDKTMEYLRRAKESLSRGYMHRIEGGFVHYMNCLEENEEGRIYVDTDLSVKIERGGEARALDYFSAGFSDIVMLCMRLALIDALFEGEKPFIIMDDPLVNLDDEHTKKALALINKLGGEHQIIYLSCNSSRC
ncbi:MAG: AAA family ATPase [Bacillota bacterium]|nr:AAA family ATPase [Bacillota bacterium]